MVAPEFKNSLFNLNQFYDEEFQEHLKVTNDTWKALQNPFQELVSACVKAIENGNKILFFGNGGSAADAQHLATELVVRYRHNRIPIAAIALTTDSSALTAIGNDLGFDQLFARQIEALGQPGDVAIGITTSGKSKNIILGLEMAIKKGITPAVLTGKDGGNLHGIGNPMLIVPSNTTARIQEMHIMVGQMLCDALEKALDIPTYPA